MHDIEVIFEDNHLLGIVKPCGLLVQGDHTGDTTALELARRYIKEKYAKPGNVYLGLVHRLDRPVSGVVVFARTSKAASRLSRAFHDRLVQKEYLAVVLGDLPQSAGTLTGLVERTHLKSRLVESARERSREAVMHYRVIAAASGRSLVQVTPETGRHHQIRLQLSHAGCPVAGDLKYGAREPLPDRSIALHAYLLSVPHPITGEAVMLVSAPRGGEWNLFSDAIADHDRRGV